MTTRKIALGVALGILAALAVVFVIYQWSQPSDLECSLERANVLTGQMSQYEINDACR